MDAQLRELAEAHGVATGYRDGQRRWVDVAPEVVVAVLGCLDVAAGTPAAVRGSLAEARAGRDGPPDTVTVTAGRTHPVPDGVLRAEDGTERAVRDQLPATLAPGWYTLERAGGPTTVLVAPTRLRAVPDCWGWALGAYALHSPGSWGMGDYADLRDLVRWSGDELGAGVVQCNPLHAPVLADTVEPSPYSPSSRRFANPLYLRVEELAEYAAADAATRAEVDALRPARPPLIDYDAVWAAKRAALELLWRQTPRSPVTDPALREYATWCALAECHGGDWRRWPAELRHPDSSAVAREAEALADRVGFHAWLQRCCAGQLSRVTAAAGGMAVGLLHDLPVGVDPAGADAWACQDVLAGGVSVGAPPDAFTAAGQDWGLPPWRPDRLAATGYHRYRQLLDAAFAHGGGLRVDHVAGLFRLWWIPPGGSPADGTYVGYDAAAMLGALTLAAYRRSAVVVGEDLGTVEPEVTDALRARHMLGCQVLWFARDDDGRPVPPADWPREATASISTHDLPTAAGFLTAEHVRVRDRLGLLAGPPGEAAEAAGRERRDVLDLLAGEGLDTGGDTAATVEALHALLARTPCRVRLASPADVLGEVRMANVPGTTDSYPNWRIPLPESLPELMTDPRPRRVAELLSHRD